MASIAFDEKRLQLHYYISGNIEDRINLQKTAIDFMQCLRGEAEFDEKLQGMIRPFAALVN